MISVLDFFLIRTGSVVCNTVVSTSVHDIKDSIIYIYNIFICATEERLLGGVSVSCQVHVRSGVVGDSGPCSCVPVKRVTSTDQGGPDLAFVVRGTLKAIIN